MAKNDIKKRLKDMAKSEDDDCVKFYILLDILQDILDLIKDEPNGTES